MALESIFKRDDIRGIYPKEINGDVAAVVGRALVKQLRKQFPGSITVVVGHDCRMGSVEVAQGLMRGIQEERGRIIDLGLVSTEHVYFACGEHADDCTAGAMVTASHNPKEYNGIKFLYSGCLPFTAEDLKELRLQSERELVRRKFAIDFDEYAEKMIALAGFERRAKGKKTPFRLVVLAGNGMGGLGFEPIAKRLEEKGLETEILDGEPDGTFPQGVPNPLLPEFIKRLSKEVTARKADLGVVFDGDADRAGFVDASGNEIIPSQTLALIAQRKVAGKKKVIVMRNLCCSQLIRDIFAEDESVEVVDTPVGHGRIKQLMRSDAFKSRAVFAGEHSGHFFYPEFHYVDSGVLTALNMLAIAWKAKEEGKSLEEILAPWRENYVWSGERNFTMADQEAVQKALQAVWKKYRQDGVVRYGVRQDDEIGAQRVFVCEDDYNAETLAAPDLKMVCDNRTSGWWFVLRPSGNEPKLRLNVEAWGAGAAKKCASLTKEIEAILKK